jgi:D-alanyl-D-alanine dipeptidase
MINIMEKNGFRVLDTEWWHFTLIDEPFKDTYFNFDVK